MANDLLTKTLVLYYILTFGCYNGITLGTVTISPSTVAPVCRVGEHLLLTCSSTNASFLKWRFLVVQEEGLVEERSSFVNINDVSDQTSNVVVNSTTFTFMRASTQGASPFVTILLIDHVSSGLNGTVIECAEVDGTMEVNSTTIHIIGINNGHFNTSFVVLNMSEIFGVNKIMLVFRLSQESDVVFNVSIVPQAPVNFTTSTDLQLTLSYNTSYNFTIEAATICRNSSVFNTEFNYLKCGRPLSATADNISLPRISGYSGIPGSEVSLSCSSGLVLIGNKTATCMSNGRWYPDPTEVICSEAKCGHPLNTSREVDDFTLGESVIAHSNSSNSSTINFSCPPGYALTGPSSTTCMSNGQWQPDPSGVACNKVSIEDVNCGSPSLPPNGFISSYTNTSFGASVTFVCQCLNPSSEVHMASCKSNEIWEPNPAEYCSRSSTPYVDDNLSIIVTCTTSSVATVLISNVIIFIIGFVCGHCFNRKRTNQMESTSGSNSDQPNPTYESLTLNDHERELELKENVAYCPIQRFNQ